MTQHTGDGDTPPEVQQPALDVEVVDDETTGTASPAPEAEAEAESEPDAVTGNDNEHAPFAVGDRVILQRRADDEPQCGVIVDDYGEHTAAVDVGAIHVAAAARRWAVQLDDGNLTFADTEHLKHP